MSLITRRPVRPARADARLIELVKQFRRHRGRIDALSRVMDRATYKSPAYVEADLAIGGLVRKCWRIREAVTDLPAFTAAGMTAKAWLAEWETCDGDPEVGPVIGSAMAVAWSLARDVLGRATA